MTKLSSCWLVQNSNIPKLNIDSLTVGSIDVALVTVIWISRNRSTKLANLGFSIYTIFGVSESICLRNLHPILILLQQPSIWFTLCSVCLKCNVCRMQLLGLYLIRMFLEHQYYVRYIGFLSNFVLILKYFFLLLKLYIYLRSCAWLLDSFDSY